MALDLLGRSVQERDAAEALRWFRRARAAFSAMPAPLRESGYARQFEWFGQCSMAVSFARQGQRSEALAAAHTGLGIAEKHAAAPSASFDARLAPWMCRFEAARARRALGDDAAAAALLEETAAGLRPVLARRPSTIVPYIGLVETLELLAALLPGQRCRWLDEASAAWRSWPGAPTPYTRRRAAELDAARAKCPP
jgi:hypothetical protein